jgi:hydroxymethylpyrimidine/phosphomethylpyrimidine kinase
MGHILPDRLFWAELEDGTETPADADERMATAEDFSLPRHETKH